MKRGWKDFKVLIGDLTSSANKKTSLVYKQEIPSSKRSFKCHLTEKSFDTFNAYVKEVKDQALSSGIFIVSFAFSNFCPCDIFNKM